MIEIIKKYAPLIIFITLTLAGLAISYLLDKEAWRFWGNLDSAFAVALGVLAFMGYLEYIRSEDEIKIYFKVNEKKLDTGLTVLRKDCNRSEILGILGMIQKDSKNRFDIKYMKKRGLLKKLYDIQKGSEKELIIYLDEEELEQFDIKLDD